MRQITASSIRKALGQALVEANTMLSPDMLSALRQAEPADEREARVLAILRENSDIAAHKGLPLCQDTGMVVLFVAVGEQAGVPENLEDLLQEVVRQTYQDHFFRKSLVRDPLERINTGDNTPAMIHWERVPGDRLSIRLMVKGGGSENASALTMLTPSAGAEGIVKFVVERVKKVGMDACPPLVLGIGIGGSFESCPLLAKKALFRPVGDRNSNPVYAAMEEQIRSEANDLRIGAGGLGGAHTVLDVFIEAAPCHIASLPVAVNVGCNSHRHREIRL